MSRTEIYAEIKKHNLQNAIKEKYGWNYTNLTTATLAKEMNEFLDTLNKNLPSAPVFPAMQRVNALIEILYKKHLICKSEYEALMS